MIYRFPHGRCWQLVMLLSYGLTAVWLPAEVHGQSPRRKATPQQPSVTDSDSQSQLKHNHQSVYEALMHGTAYIESTPVAGQAWSGTGWVVDAERRLMITNEHVVNSKEYGQARSLVAWFPVEKDGEAIHEVQYYMQSVKSIPLKVIYTDAHRDLAMVQLESLPEGVHALDLAAKSAATGERLHSLGGFPRGSRGMFIYTQGTSRAIYKRPLARGGEISVLETQMPLNQGNSGGPIVNDDGQVVAVFEGLVVELGVQLVNMCIDLSEVKVFLDETESLVDPASVELWNRRGDAHFEAGRYQLAFDDFTAALQLDPKNVDAISSRGWVYYQQKDLETAMAEFNAALKLDPNLAYALWGRGSVFHDRGEFSEAVASFTEAIRHVALDKDKADLFNERGNALLAQEDYQAALADYDRSIAANPQQGWPHANRADTLRALGRFDEAIESLGKAIEIEPNNADFWNLAGNVWFSRGRYDLAVNLYTQALERNSKEPMYYRNRGAAARRMGQPLDAIPDLQKAIELDEQSDDFWNELGLALLEAGQYNHAYTAFTRASEIDSQVASYWQSRGEAAALQNQHEQAIIDFGNAIELEDGAELRVLRGNAYQALGRTSAAQADYRKASELDSTYKLYDRRYLQVVNNSEKPLTVYLRYHTKTTSGNWKWFPDTPGQGTPVQYSFSPGETGTLFHEDWKVNASRVRLWAEGGGLVWHDYRDKDLTLAPNGGYLSNDDDFDTYTYSFNP